MQRKMFGVIYGVILLFIITLLIITQTAGLHCESGNGFIGVANQHDEYWGVFVMDKFTMDTNGIITSQLCFPTFKHWKTYEK